jgi:hypothetical protein
MRGGMGVVKAHFIRNLFQEMDERKITYIAVAPTNKACRIINGITIHKLIASFHMKRFIIGIDEDSMVQEICYIFLIT